MAIVRCPQCRKRISSLAPSCPHCGHGRDGDGADPDELREIERRRLRDRVYHANMLSYVAITLFVAGFGWYWWQSDGFTAATGAGPWALMALGAAGYAVIRLWLFATRRSLRQLRQQR